MTIGVDHQKGGAPGVERVRELVFTVTYREN
jgi:hypothetical protein